MNEIVITGSTGVIGQRTVRELLAAGHHERRTVGMRALGQRRDEVGPHRLRHERMAAIGDEGGPVNVFGEA